MSRIGRGFIRQPWFVATLHVIETSVDLTLTEADGARSFGRVGSVAISTAEDSGDHTEQINGVGSIGKSGSVSISIDEGPEPEVVLLDGIKSTGQVGQLTVSANAGSGWELVTDRASVWRRVEDFRTAADNPGDVDFTVIVSSFNGTWKVSTSTDETVQLRSELSISADTLVEGKP